MSVDNSRQFYTGLLFAAVGVAAIVLSGTYGYGTLLNIGPGFLPSLVGGLLTLIGIGMVVRSWSRDRSQFRVARWQIKPILIVTVSILGFSALVDSTGVFVSSVFLLVVGSLAGSVRSKREIALMALLYPLAIVALFVYGLNMPFRVWPF